MPQKLSVVANAASASAVRRRTCPRRVMAKRKYSAADQLRGRLTVVGDQLCNIQAFYLAIHHLPAAADNHPVSRVGAARKKGGERVMAAGEARLVQLEQRRSACLPTASW